MMVRACLCLLLCFLQGVCLAGGAAIQPVTTVEGMTEYALDNGLHVILARDTSKPVVTVNVTYRVGSRMEGAGETGMAHLLEHLVFKGSPKHPDIYRDMSLRGMKSNGSTWNDRTNYFETFNATGDNLEWALGMEADRMVNSYIARKDLDAEMTVVRNEMERGENNPYSVLYQIAMNAAYRWHPYGKHTIGARSDVENVSIDHLQAFYRRYYQPDNAVVVVSGSFDTAQVLGWVVRYFGGIPKPTRVLAPTYTVEPPQEGPREVTLARTGENRLLLALYHVPPAQHPDRPALQVLRALLINQGGRLSEALVKTGKATQVGGSIWTSYDPGILGFEALMRREDDPALVRQILLNTLEGLASKPVSEEEVARARQTLRAEMDRQLDDPGAFGIALSESIAAGDWRYFFWLRDGIPHVTPAEVMRVAQAYLQANNRTLGEFVPQNSSAAVAIPGRTNLTAAYDALPVQSSIAQGEDFDPTPANLDARTRRASLDNGLQLAMLPRRTRGEKVQLALELRIGDADSLAGQGTLVSLIGNNLLSGTALHTRTQIIKQFEALESTINVSASGQVIHLNVSTRRSHMPEVISLLREILREPEFPQDELERIVRQRIGSARNNAQDPAVRATRALSHHLNPLPVSDPRYLQDEKEFESSAKALSHTDLKQFWQHFTGGEHTWIGVVGDFDPDTLRPLLQKALGDWRGDRPYRGIADKYLEIPSLTRIIEIPGKQNAELRGGIRFPLSEKDADYPAMLVATQLMGGGFLNSRLATRLRQREGLSYNTSASLAVNTSIQNASFQISAIYAPQYRERVEQAVREEIQRAYANGFSEQELQDGRNAVLQSLRQTRSDDVQLANTLIRNMRLKRDFAYIADVEKRIAALNREALNAATHRYLDPSRLSLIFAGTFAAETK